MAFFTFKFRMKTFKKNSNFSYKYINKYIIIKLLNFIIYLFSRLSYQTNQRNKIQSLYQWRCLEIQRYSNPA